MVVADDGTLSDGNVADDEQEEGEEPQQQGVLLYGRQDEQEGAYEHIGAAQQQPVAVLVAEGATRKLAAGAGTAQGVQHMPEGPQALPGPSSEPTAHTSAGQTGPFLASVQPGPQPQHTTNWQAGIPGRQLPAAEVQELGVPVPFLPSAHVPHLQQGSGADMQPPADGRLQLPLGQNKSMAATADVHPVPSNTHEAWGLSAAHVPVQTVQVMGQGLPMSGASAVDAGDYLGAATNHSGVSGLSSQAQSPTGMAPAGAGGAEPASDARASGGEQQPAQRAPASASGLKRVWGATQGAAGPLLIPLHLSHVPTHQLPYVQPLPQQLQQQLQLQAKAALEAQQQPQPRQSSDLLSQSSQAHQHVHPMQLLPHQVPQPQGASSGFIEVGLVRDILQQCTQMVAVAAATAAATAVAAMASPRCQRRRIESPTASIVPEHMSLGSGSLSSLDADQSQPHMDQRPPLQPLLHVQPPMSPQQPALEAPSQPLEQPIGTSGPGRSSAPVRAASLPAGSSVTGTAAAGPSSRAPALAGGKGGVIHLPDFLSAPGSQSQLRVEGSRAAAEEDREEEATRPVTMADVQQDEVRCGLLNLELCRSL